MASSGGPFNHDPGKNARDYCERMIYVRVYCVLHVPSVSLEMLRKVEELVDGSCPSQACIER